MMNETERNRRRAALRITYPDLPVSERRDDIARAISENQVVIISGETGSGKTTQLPKICLELGRGSTGLIGHTQPRRIAARSVAERLASELNVGVGDEVGYQVRFTDDVSNKTLVKLMTDGILLAEIQHDPLLTRYDTIIIDEAHERSLNIDFLLGYLAQLLPQRPDLKVIITSATIDSERFAQHFGPLQATPAPQAPILSVSGRTYPVEIRYRDDEPDMIDGIIESVEDLCAEGPGDILVFLSGEGEIRDVEKALKDSLGTVPAGHGRPGKVEVLPLYARLSAAEQHRIFAPHEWRRIILATNIAETSLTVPGIRYVIDPGTARISRYSNKTKVQRLPIEKISQASANQRSGRCGRVADGIAIRLYSEEDFEARPEFTEPEIQRTSLASVILHMLALGLGDVSSFPFVDPPQMSAIRAGTQLLAEIGAVTNGRITKIGRTLARLPIDPRLGRMLLEAQRNGVISEVLVIVAALSVQDVRERPTEKRDEADQFHDRFTDSRSDFLAYLNLWRYLGVMKRDLSGSAFRRLCRNEYLNYLRYREWLDVVTQLKQIGRQLGARRLPLPQVTGDPAVAVRGLDQKNSELIHKSLLVGLLSSLGSYDQRRKEYEGTRGSRFVIWPGSGLHGRTPDWVVAAELVETSRLFARTVAQVKPEWIEPLAAHVTNRTYSEPFWSTKHGAAMVHEKVLIYGLTLIADRHVLLSKVGTQADIDLARELFIRHALVEGQWRDNWHPFMKKNKQRLEEAREIEKRRREHSLVADEREREQFFDERIPADIVSAAHFNQWYKRNKSRVDLTYPMSLLVGSEDASEDDYPSVVSHHGIDLPVTYGFDPGADHDGLTIDIPVTVLPQLDDTGFDWLVPGMLPELTEATIRSLPKRLRRQLVPAPDVARSIMAALPDWEEARDSISYRDAFAKAVQDLRGVTIDEWGDLPPHLAVTFRVIGDKKRVLSSGPSIDYLKKKLAPRTKDAVSQAVKQAVKESMNTRLPSRGFGEGLPLSVTTGGVKGYPALTVTPAGVTVEIHDNPRSQVRAHTRGVHQMVADKLALPSARVTSRWDPGLSLTMAGSPYASTDALVDDLQRAAVRHLAPRVGQIRHENEFDDLVASLRDRFEDEVWRLAQIVGRILASYLDLVRALDHAPASMSGIVHEERDHAHELIYPGFISATPPDYLAHLPRYLQAATYRVEHAGENLATDDQRITTIMDAQDLVEQFVPETVEDDAKLTKARWMIEELRVSLFAQRLGTPTKVSPQRIRKLLQ